MLPTSSSFVSANTCINHNFIIKLFFVDVWLQIPKGVIFIYRSGFFQRIEKCCGPFCELLLSIT